MQDLNEKHDLKINDDYISKAFREADWDYSRSIDYDEFLSTFAGKLMQLWIVVERDLLNKCVLVESTESLPPGWC